MFFKSMTKEECTKLFRKLALRLHPDHGGTNELMILLQDSYDERIKFIELLQESINEMKKKEEQIIYEKSEVYEKITNDDPRINILKEIYEYSKSHKMRLDFIDSVNEFLKEKGYITNGQYNTLVKIFYQFEIDKSRK